MLTDSRKGISGISYNHLNLPKQVTINGKTISYTYDASGTKLQKTSDGVTTDYLDGYQYQNGDLQFFPHAEGYVTGDDFEYVYILADHLGNTRIKFTDLNKSGSIEAGNEILEESNYYPFGLKHRGYNNITLPLASTYKYKYNGKELQVEHELDWYDYGARFYDAGLGRFTGIDTLSDEFFGLSPYNYASNSPIVNIDLWGLQAWNVNNKWNDNYIQQYRQQLRNTISFLEKEGIEFTCEDLALELLITYAKDNELPFKWETGSQSFDASSEEYDDFKTFKSDIQEKTGARDFARNTNTTKIEYERIRPGDVVVLTAEGKENPNHIQVISGLFKDEGVLKGYNAVQGNFNWLGRLGSNNPESPYYMGVPIQRGFYSEELDYWNNYSEKKITYDFFKSHYRKQTRKYNFSIWNK